MPPRNVTPLKADPRPSLEHVANLVKDLLEYHETLTRDAVVHRIMAIECDLADVRDIYAEDEA